MLHLLAYLLIRGSNNELETSVHRTLEALKQEWLKTFSQDPDATGVITVGFERPDPSIYSLVPNDARGRVLFAESSRYAFPQAFKVSSVPHEIETQDGPSFKVYMALTGWGYEVDHPNQTDYPTESSHLLLTKKTTDSNFSDWVKVVTLKYPNLITLLLDCEIYDEESYLKNESKLSFPIRDATATFRYEVTANAPVEKDTIMLNLRALPPWLINVSLSSLGLSVRINNSLSAQGINLVSDLEQIGSLKLMKIPNFGNRSFGELASGLVRAFGRGSKFCVSLESSIHSVLRERENIQPLSNEALNARSSLKHLIKLGKGRGHVTHEEINNFLSKGLVGTEAVDTIVSSLKAAGIDVFDRHTSIEGSSIIVGLISILESLPQRHREVFRARMGWGESANTLEEVGRKFGLTRERVRQIESKSLRFIVQDASLWIKDLDMKLSQALLDRESPLLVVGLGLIDPWFKDCESTFKPFSYVLEKFFSPPKYFIVEIDGHSYVTRLSAEMWQKALKTATSILETRANDEPVLLENEARLLVESQINRDSSEMRSMLWHVATLRAHFYERSDGVRVLGGYGLSAERVVEAVLKQSDTPLHYSELAKLCNEKGHDLDIRRVHNAAASVGLLLSRGVYGLEKHIDISLDERDEIISQVQNIFSENLSKQWHTSELVEELAVRGFDYEGRLSSYELDAILKAGSDLAYLGRMVWAVRSDSALGVGNRVNLWQAVVSLLQSQSGPMTHHEIKAKLSKDRGLRANFQIFPGDPLIRVGEGLWGLLWRDVPFGSSEADDFVHELLGLLSQTGQGIHHSEIVSSLQSTRSFAVKADPILLASLAARHEKISLDRGGYLYLPDWGNSRRLTQVGALKKALELHPEGVTVTNLTVQVSEMLGRDVDRRSVAALLMKLAEYDHDGGIWIAKENNQESDFRDNSSSQS